MIEEAAECLAIDLNGLTGVCLSPRLWLHWRLALESGW